MTERVWQRQDVCNITLDDDDQDVIEDICVEANCERFGGTEPCKCYEGEGERWEDGI